MKATVYIEGLSIEDLALFLENALTDQFTGGYDIKKVPDGCEFTGKESKAEKLAKVLVHGGRVAVYDNAAEGVVYGSRGRIDENDPDETGIYALNLDDIRQGLAKCATGTFKAEPVDKISVLEYWGDFLFNRKDFNSYEASVLLQIILFGEWIYC